MSDLFGSLRRLAVIFGIVILIAVTRLSEAETILTGQTV
jgi:hypothetical protein